MYYKSGDTLIKSGTTYFKQVVDTLTFQYEGDKFPENSIGETEWGIFRFESEVEQSVIVNYGDGTSETFTLTPTIYGTYGVLWKYDNLETSRTPDYGTFAGNHIFQDGNTGRRNITFTFDDLSKIIVFNTIHCLLYGLIPSEIGYATGLKEFGISSSRYVEEFPESIIDIKTLEVLQIASISQTKLNKIPDAFFNKPLRTLHIGNTFNLSDKISSNLFKINQLKDTLTSLYLDSSNISILLNEIGELINLKDFRVHNNPIREFPEEIDNLTKLNRFYIGDDQPFNDVNLPNFQGFNNLEYIMLLIPNLDFSQIPSKFRHLVSLKEIINTNRICTTNARFDEFINALYTLCTNEANITEDPNAFGGEYPLRFRDISWGHSSLAFTGTKQAPQGYIQGVSNGTPANEGEKVYVLQNQYGHVISHA